jgi:hypothetical protein
MAETGLRAHEQMRIGGLGTGRRKIVQDRVADILRQWQAVRPTRLALDRQVAGPPVDIVEVHVLNIASPQAEPGEQENDGLVPDFHRAICRQAAMICSIVAGSTCAAASKGGSAALMGSRATMPDGTRCTTRNRM